MATRNADVNLIVRAKTEGERAIAGLADVLDKLVNGAREGSADVGALGKALAALDKAGASLSSSQEKVGSSASRQAASIHAANAGIEEQSQRVETLRRGVSILAAESDKAFIGPRRSGLSDLLKTAKTELSGAERALGGFERQLSRGLEGLRGSRSGLLELKGALASVGEGQSAAQAKIAATTQALDTQAVAAERAAQVQSRLASIRNSQYQDSGKSAESSAGVFASAGLTRTEREIAATEQLARDEQQLSAALREQNQLRERGAVLASIRNSQYQDSGKSAESSAGVFASAGLTRTERDASEASEQMEREAKQLRAALDPLAAIQERLNTQLARYRELAGADKLKADELAKAEEHLALQANRAREALANSGGTGKLGLFGLKPYEFQNLSYQINDVFTGLASGQHLTQVIAQQGGQILQLFPKVANSGIGAFSNPAVLGFVATVGALALGIKHAADDSERLRANTAMLSARSDGASYDPKALADQEKTFQRLGATADESRTAVRAFLEQSVAPDKLQLFSQAAQATADALGQKLPEAAKDVAQAFTGGYDAIAKFDDKLNFLTASEREHIRTLFEEGHASEARTEALRIYASKQQEVADKSRGEWAGAARELKGAWAGFMEYIASSAPVQTLVAALTALAGAARVALTDINNLSNASGTLQEIADKRKYIADLQTKIKANPNAADIGASKLSLEDAQRGLQTLIQRYNELAKAQGKTGLNADGSGGAKPSGDTVNASKNSAEAKRAADEVHRISIEDELQRLRDAGQQRLLTAQERARREELAGQEAARSASDAVVAAAEKRRAVAHETAQIEKETDARAKTAAADREKAIRDFAKAVGGAEGGAGQNPYSSAVGIGQLTRSTAIGVYKSVNPQTKLNDDQIADLRRDPAVAQKLVDVLTRTNADFLDKLGKSVNGANLYLVHFLGQAGARRALQAAPDTPVNQIGLSADALSGNAGYLRTGGGKGRYRTVSELQKLLGNKVGSSSSSATSLIGDEAHLIQDATNKQNAFNTAVQHGADDRRDAVKALQEENTLYGTALLNAQRKKAITDAEREIQQKAEDANKNLKPGQSPVVVSPAQVKEAKDLAAALFDASHAKEYLNASLADTQRPIDELTEQRDLLKEQAEFLRSIGEDSQANNIDEQIRKLDGDIGSAYDKLIEFYQALSPDQRTELGIIDERQLNNIIAKLEHAKQVNQEWGKVGPLAAQQVAQAFAGAATSALKSFIERVASGKDVFKALGQTVREFAAGFISSIAQALVQLLAFSAAVQVLRALGVPIPANIGVGALHTGGIAGSSAGGLRRSVTPGLFTAALRYHAGGIAGLAPDEVPAILQRQEEVLTTSDPRHRFNSGLHASKGGEPPSIKIVNTFNKEEAADMLLRTRAGERAFLNYISVNSRTVKAALG